MTDADLNHRIEGPEDAPWLVLSNSLGTTMAMWDRQMPALAERFRVVRYDQLGHGGSPAPPGEYTIDELGRLALGLMDRLGIERASFAGVSLGGMVGMWVASEAPERIDRLVPACTSAMLGPPSMWEERAAAVRSGGMEAVADATLGRWLTDDAPQEDVDFLRAILLSTPPEGYAAACAAVRDMDLRDRLPRIKAPTLVIGGDRDLSTPPEHQEAIAAGIPGAELIILENARHLANVERHDEFTRLLLGHLDGAGR
jgi:3-oxoadipate enol-lactonase